MSEETSPPAMQRVLGCVLGLSPQILTETVWALAINSRPNWTPDRLNVFTTGAGADALAAMCHSPLGSPLQRLGMRYERDDVFKLADKLVIHVFDGGDGNEMYEAVYTFVRNLTANPASEVHLSIAGGRKSTAVLAALAMSMCARREDRMSHIIATKAIEEQGFDYIPDRKLRPDLPTLIEIPFPKLGHLNTQDEPYWLSSVGGLQAKLTPLRIEFNLSVPSLRVGAHTLQIQPIHAAFLLCLMDTENGVKAHIPRSGFQSRILRAAYLRVARHRTVPSWPNFMAPERVQELVARINKLVLARQGVHSHGRLIVLGEGRPKTTYRLNSEHYELELK